MTSTAAPEGDAVHRRFLVGAKRRPGGRPALDECVDLVDGQYRCVAPYRRRAQLLLPAHLRLGGIALDAGLAEHQHCDGLAAFLAWKLEDGRRVPSVLYGLHRRGGQTGVVGRRGTRQPRAGWRLRRNREPLDKLPPSSTFYRCVA